MQQVKTKTMEVVHTEDTTALVISEEIIPSKCLHRLFAVGLKLYRFCRA